MVKGVGSKSLNLSHIYLVHQMCYSTNKNYLEPKGSVGSTNEPDFLICSQPSKMKHFISF